MVAKKLSAPNVTKTRLLDATEALFIKYGYDAVLLRQITERAQVNLAAVNYHFGDKDSLMKTLLMQRLEPLNEQRLELLARCEAESDGPLDCDTLLGVLFAPAMGLERSDPASGEGRSFIRFLGRVYSDTSPLSRNTSRCITSRCSSASSKPSHWLFRTCRATSSGCACNLPSRRSPG